MAQHANVLMSPVRYSRTDFTALRAWIQRTPPEKIAKLYYSDDAPQVVHGLEKFLTAMRQELIERAIVANPRLADALSRARAGGAITSWERGPYPRLACGFPPGGSQPSCSEGGRMPQARL